METLSYLLLNIDLSGGNVVVEYDALEATGAAYSGWERWYDLEGSTNLRDAAAWGTVQGEGGHRGDGTLHQYLDSSGYSKRYYRLKTELSP